MVVGCLLGLWKEIDAPQDCLFMCVCGHVCVYNIEVLKVGLNSSNNFIHNEMVLISANENSHWDGFGFLNCENDYSFCWTTFLETDAPQDHPSFFFFNLEVLKVELNFSNNFRHNEMVLVSANTLRWVGFLNCEDYFILSFGMLGRQCEYCY